ncbi:MAG: GreA/GreB family elongation factor [Candidatus Cloacimonetes bacterium]|nr:GreA/GreB family elongation factor [Candidatus Cloacimonadota bacterium]MDY0172985.1 GreA/GreB family elongation factor [Candidatus Cloacimonadaceae bacterium]
MQHTLPVLPACPLLSSRVAQGQANRAQEIKQSIEIYKSLNLTVDSEAIRVTSLVTIDADDGSSKTVFIGPVEGGMKITDDQIEIILITPASPLGKALIGKSLGDYIEIDTGSSRMEYEIAEIS